MSPHKSVTDLVLGGWRARRAGDDPPSTTGTLQWHHTELGRRTDDEQYRIVRHGDGWVLLDAEWNGLAVARTIKDAQQLAERLARRLPRGTSESSQSFQKMRGQ